MSASVGFSASGFSVVANNAIDFIAGTEAAGAGYVGANIQELARSTHQDSQQLMSVLSTKSNEIIRTNQEGFAELNATNQAGFSQLDSTMGHGFSSLKQLSGMQIAVQATGFAVVATQLHKLRIQAEQLVRLQQVANQRLEKLVDLAQRSLDTQEKILDTLLTSRTVEAQQLLRQGWENLKHGYDAEALSRFEQSLQHDNTIYIAHAYLARLYRKSGDKTRVEDHYVRATKFSTSVNPEVHALACIEYATWLEDESRYAECVAQLRNALQHADNPRWRFHLAELLTRIQQPDAALDELRRAIEADAELHAASMVSQDLVGGLGPALVRLLAELDEARRRPGFDHMQAICRDIDRLDAIASLESPVASAQRHVADDLRQQAAAILRDLIGATYVEVPGPTQRAYELRGRTAAEASAAAQRHAGALQAWVSAWDQSIRRQLVGRPRAPTTPLLRRLFGWLLVGATGLSLIPVLGELTDEYRNEREIVMFGIVAVILGGAAAALLIGDARRLRKSAAVSLGWQRHWDARATAIGSLLAEVRSSAQNLLRRWSATVLATEFQQLESALNQTLSLPLATAPSTSPPPELPVAAWLVLARSPFGAVPTFAVGPDGSVTTFGPAYS